MMIEEVNGHYTLWRDANDFVVKQHGHLITRGTKAECYEYMTKHPYGTPRKENE